MGDTLGPPGLAGSRKRLEEWRRGIRKEYIKAVRIVRRMAGVSEDRAYECLNTALVKMMEQWLDSGPPATVGNWAAYLAHSAVHEHFRPPCKDQKLLVFMPPVADQENTFALDVPADEPEPQEMAVQKEQFEKVWAKLAEIPERQVLTVVLWAIGLSFAGIAYALDTTESHARSLKHKGIEALKAEIFRDSSHSEVRSDRETTRR